MANVSAFRDDWQIMRCSSFCRCDAPIIIDGIKDAEPKRNFWQTLEDLVGSNERVFVYTDGCQHPIWAKDGRVP